MTKLSKKAKKIKETRPLEPFVSTEQILAFDPERQETYTESRAVNEVLLAIEVKKLLTTGEIAAYLAVDSVMLRYTMMLETGMKVNDIIRTRTINKLKKIMEAEPTISADKAAKAIGYCDHGTIYKILGREEYDKMFPKYVKTSVKKRKRDASWYNFMEECFRE